MGSVFRLVGLWMVLVVGFVGFYQVFSTPGSGVSHPTEAAVSPWPSVALQSLPVLVFVVVFPVVFFRLRRLTERSLEGVQLLQSGRSLAALEMFTGLQKSAPQNWANLHNVAFAQLTLWRVADAKATVAKLEAQKMWRSAIDHLGAVHALILALGADVGGAKALAGRPKSKLDAGRYALAQAAIACRDGNFAEAVTELEKYEVKQLGGFLAALAQALKAWSVEKTTGRLLPIDRVLLFGESGPEGMKLAWPEFAEFVARAPAQ